MCAPPVTWQTVTLASPAEGDFSQEAGGGLARPPGR